MIDIDIDKAALDRALTKLGKVEHLQRELKPAMATSLNYMWRRVARNPRKAAGAFSALATDRQRRAYWAKVRGGTIDHRDGVGYVRTGTASRSWTMKIDMPPGAIEGALGNNVDYARFLFSREAQQPFHAASKWPVIEDVADDATPFVNRTFQARIRQIINS